MASDSILADLDELDTPRAKSVGFRKKVVKGRNVRSKVLEWEAPAAVDGPDLKLSSRAEDETATTKDPLPFELPEKALSDSPKDSSTGAVSPNAITVTAPQPPPTHYKQPGNFNTRKILNRMKRKLHVEVEEASEAFDEDPENNPMVENLEDLDTETISSIANFTTVRNDASVGPEEKKYVPVPGETEPVFKVTEKELREEYDDKFNYDDGANDNNTEVKYDADVDNDIDMDEEHAGKLNLGGLDKPFEINQEMYDLELGVTSEEDNIPEEAASKVADGLRTFNTKLHEVLSIQNQVSAINDLISQLQSAQISINNERQVQQAELDRTRERKNTLLQELAQ
ncbi:uncharacterized protein CANTADRAFT_4021 [Suhomyces tanzawaensis NRRL Y-17324]|uniref:Uncharacterized protein n=1 Tax=Suhomyces tanzawaensis NRRL Y-17324 TaxID=984487 RepID=A0A1E4SR34_9ASCO|nr:uncharacterized protein CANTADRAFT_4021 [Suhomyces tanzawaensis NRRL Y-17324]ODV81970.1 hypothetical protein CANTADRAFT_4021 [Suhomyces tanzawaensis NRRL Y-17324]